MIIDCHVHVCAASPGHGSMSPRLLNSIAFRFMRWRLGLRGEDASTEARVAALLGDALEKLAAARGAKRLTVDASDTARGFFERRGFQAQRRGTVSLGGEWLGNTAMEKRLTP